MALARTTRSKNAAADKVRKLAIDMARLIEDDRSDDIVLLDVRGRSPVTDFFIIATGTSDRQRRTVAEDVVKHARAHGQPVLSVSGLEQPDWVLADLVDIVVHVFDPAARKFYDLDSLWGDAPRIRWQRRSGHKASE